MKKTFQILKEYALCEEYLDEPSRWRALWFGFFSSWYRLRRDNMSNELKQQIRNEYHWFTAGFFIGRAVQSVCVVLGGKWII